MVLTHGDTSSTFVIALTCFYPDTTSMPVAFKVLADTLVLNGAKSSKYPILKQTAHLFIFANQNGEQIKLVKSGDAGGN